MKKIKKYYKKNKEQIKEKVIKEDKIKIFNRFEYYKFIIYKPFTNRITLNKLILKHQTIKSNYIIIVLIKITKIILCYFNIYIII
jgi:hypothetical protein